MSCYVSENSSQAKSLSQRLQTRGVWGFFLHHKWSCSLGLVLQTQNSIGFYTVSTTRRSCCIYLCCVMPGISSTVMQEVKTSSRTMFISIPVSLGTLPQGEFSMQSRPGSGCCPWLSHFTIWNWSDESCTCTGSHGRPAGRHGWPTGWHGWPTGWHGRPLLQVPGLMIQHWGRMPLFTPYCVITSWFM